MNGQQGERLEGRGEKRTRRVAVVCPGPGAAVISGSELDYSDVVGVNRAVLRVPCTWWVCLDAHTADWVFAEGGPVIVPAGIVASLAVYREIASRHPAVSGWGHVEHTAPALDMPRARVSWRKFSASVALVVAAKHLAAASIDCYGVAWDGELDFDGFKHDRQRRDADRWAEDERVWRATAGLLVGKGIQVRRMVCHFQEVAGDATATAATKDTKDGEERTATKETEIVGAGAKT